MELDKERDQEYTEYIKSVAADPAQGDEPRFVYPSASYGKHQTGPDEHLFESRTAPDDRCTGTRFETNGILSHHKYRVSEKGYKPIDGGCDVSGHEYKGCRDIQTEPCHHLSVLIADHGELPEIVRH